MVCQEKTPKTFRTIGISWSWFPTTTAKQKRLELLLKTEMLQIHPWRFWFNILRYGQEKLVFLNLGAKKLLGIWSVLASWWLWVKWNLICEKEKDAEREVPVLLKGFWINWECPQFSSDYLQHCQNTENLCSISSITQINYECDVFFFFLNQNIDLSVLSKVVQCEGKWNVLSFLGILTILATC